MKDVAIVSACRTAIGAFGDTLKDLNGAHLASITMKEADNRANIDPAVIDDVRYGSYLLPLDDTSTVDTSQAPAILRSWDSLRSRRSRTLWQNPV